MEQIENAISQAKIGRTEINQETGAIRDRIQGRNEKTNSNTEERKQKCNGKRTSLKSIFITRICK